jgi:hypothetical protein
MANMQPNANRVIFISLLLLVISTCAFGAENPLRAGWLAFARPALEPAKYPSSFAQHDAREQAIALLLAADGKDAVAKESLGYFYLRDYQYYKAKEQFEAALKRNSKDPLLHYLLAQTNAILTATEPEKMSEECKQPIEGFKKAAEREPDNAMPLLQAASVAFDSGRTDLALPLVTEALKRSAYHLYKLPMPEDLTDDAGQSAAAWWWVQSELWGEGISRTANCAHGLRQRGDQLKLNENLSGADELYQQVSQMGMLISRSEPALTTALAVGLELQRQALENRIALNTRLNPAGVPALRDNLAKVQAAQSKLAELKAKLKTPQELNSVPARMSEQKSVVEAVLAGL